MYLAFSTKVSIIIVKGRHILIYENPRRRIFCGFEQTFAFGAKYYEITVT
jgi:hypothetical protein